MKTICIVTATRAEYGLLRNIIKIISKDSKLELLLIATGTHLEEMYGKTLTEIEQDNIKISYKVDIHVIGKTPYDIADSMSTAQKEFARIFEKETPDMLLVLGDRYELIPICSTAMIFQIPIAHISGGEITEGAIDDAIRHCLTKMSYLHFPACEEYKNRIIQLGEEPDRVFNYGDLGIENVLTTDFMKKEELAKSLALDLSIPYAIVTYHPVTLEKDEEGNQIQEILKALTEVNSYQYIITKSNNDMGGAFINQVLEEYCKKNKHAHLFSSLGSKRYLSAIKYCAFVIGNSSSGLYEVPALYKPTINIGNRQNGRIKANSIIDCIPKKEEIIKAIYQTQDKIFLDNMSQMEVPFQGNKTSYKIVEKIKEFLYNDKINLQKHFYNLSL